MLFRSCELLLYLLFFLIMPQTLVQNFLHIIYSTKNREKLIHENIEVELFNYLGGICKQLECFPIAVGGYQDHVHILCNLSRKISLMKLIEELKTHSSKWIKTKSDKFSNFYWQRGYGAFSVNPTQINQVKEYINQNKSFQDEYRMFLNKYNIDFDQRYVWD